MKSYILVFLLGFPRYNKFSVYDIRKKNFVFDLSGSAWSLCPALVLGYRIGLEAANHHACDSQQPHHRTYEITKRFKILEDRLAE